MNTSTIPPRYDPSTRRLLGNHGDRAIRTIQSGRVLKMVGGSMGMVSIGGGVRNASSSAAKGNSAGLMGQKAQKPTVRVAASSFVRPNVNHLESGLQDAAAKPANSVESIETVNTAVVERLKAMEIGETKQTEKDAVSNAGERSASEAVKTEPVVKTEGAEKEGKTAEGLTDKEQNLTGLLEAMQAVKPAVDSVLGATEAKLEPTPATVGSAETGVGAGTVLSGRRRRRKNRRNGVYTPNADGLC